MSNWKSYLKKDSLEWLLEDNNPSVKYFALTDLMEKKSNSSEVEATRSKIMTEGVVPKILSKQKPEGYWEAPHRFYLPKYKATVWTFIILAELAADGNDRRIKQTCEYILEYAQDKPSGAFSMGGDYNVLPCLTGNMLFSLIRCGYLEDPRVQKGIDWIVKYQRFDDGEKKPPKEWPYKIGILRKGESCWGKHTCHGGVVGSLKALSEIPEERRSDGVRRTIEQASEYMLKHHIYKRSHDPAQIANIRWINIGFPLNFDFLGVLLVLSKLGYKDDRMQDAIDLLLTKQNENGRWLLEKTFNGRFQTNIEQKGKESKWITLNALRSLKNFYG
jgi:hypothetical protein